MDEVTMLEALATLDTARAEVKQKDTLISDYERQFSEVDTKLAKMEAEVQRLTKELDIMTADADEARTAVTRLERELEGAVFSKRVESDT